MSEKQPAISKPHRATGGVAPSASVAGSGRSSAGGMSSHGSAGSGGPTGPGGREQFEAFELATVLSHYDVGIIQAIQDFPRGSRKAPKLVLRTDAGIYLLKRRARGKEDPFKVAFCHSLQLFLASKQFPLPHLIGTKNENNSMLQWGGATYELFEYIKGSSYDSSLEGTADAGKILSLFHKLLREFNSEYDPPRGSYHESRTVAASMEALPRTLQRKQPEAVQEMGGDFSRLLRFLNDSYNDAAKQVIDAGFNDWPKQIVHSDWHPGNMLFRGPRVVAVIDYDAARVQQRVLDVANGALQFSIIGGGEDPGTWPDYVDESRFKRFLRGYDGVPDAMLSRAELKVIPPLMVEALIAEAVIPIAATGSFARMKGLDFLKMVDRKVRWLQEHADRLSNVLEG